MQEQIFLRKVLISLIKIQGTQQSSSTTKRMICNSDLVLWIFVQLIEYASNKLVLDFLVAIQESIVHLSAIYRRIRDQIKLNILHREICSVD